MELEQPPTPNCARGYYAEGVLHLMSGKWKGMILYELLKDGSVRFATLQRQIPKVTSRMLTMQLRELENDGLVDRTVFAEVPPKVVYRLTPRGGSLKPIILAMEQWGKENI